MNDNIPKQKVCRNCQNTWREGDKYCRYCGAPMDNPSYIIKKFYTIYGPMPIKRKHVCSKCNYTWETEDKEDYCPQCGGTASTEEIEEDGFWAKKPTTEKNGFLHRLFGKEK